MQTSQQQKEREQYIDKLQELMYEIKVEGVMQKNIVSVTPETSVLNIKETLLQQRITGVPVMENGVVVGLVTLSEVIRCLEEGNCAQFLARDRMLTPPFPVVYHDEPAIHALNKLAQHNERRLLVFDHHEKFVGIITSGDITTGLLKAIRLGIRHEEISQYRARHIFQDIESDGTSLVLRYSVAGRDFTHGGEASSKIKKALQRMGASQQDVRRCAIAIYEAEMNLIIHTTNGGHIMVEITPKQIMLTVTDDGPGIPDLDKAMQEGWSTSSLTVKALGFGAGMGLPNIKRCVNEMTLTSVVGDGPGKGTTLKIIVYPS